MSPIFMPIVFSELHLICFIDQFIKGLKTQEGYGAECRILLTFVQFPEAQVSHSNQSSRY